MSNCVSLYFRTKLEPRHSGILLNFDIYEVKQAIKFCLFWGGFVYHENEMAWSR